MKTIFYFPEDKVIATNLASKANIELGVAETRYFPDREIYIRIISEVKHKTIFLFCSLDHPNNKILSLLFMAKTLKELGATKICLISPYLPYMRQDKRFKIGEAVTSIIFAKFISTFIDQLITIDPHLHRIQNLSEIFSIPTSILHLTHEISEWIRKNISSPYIIGPDEESSQWVSEIANALKAPFVIIKKIRHGDSDVTISVPDINDTSKTPVLIDDIISTGTSMMAAIHELVSRGFKHPICIGVHALFDENTYRKLINSGAQKIITSNSILNFSNEIDITNVIAEVLKKC